LSFVLKESNLRARSMVKSSINIVKNTVIRSTAEIANIFLSGIFLIYVARKLGDVNFGMYAFALSFAGVFVIFSDLGLHTILTREIVKNKKNTQIYIGNVLLTKSILTIMVFLLMCLAAKVINYPNKTIEIIFLTAFFVICTSILDFFNSVYRAYEEMEYESAIMLLNRLTIVSFGICSLYISANLEGFLWSIVVANMIWVIVSGVVIIIKYRMPVFKPDNELISSLFKQAIPIGLMILFTTIYLRTDTIILERIKGDEVVGWYNVSHRLIEILISFGTFFSAAIFPSLTNAFRNSEGSIARIYENSIRFLVIFGLPCALAITLWSDEIIEMAFGIGYMNSAIALKILIWAGVVASINTVTKYLIIAVDMQWVNAYILGLCSVVNVLLNIILIPKLSYIGACTSLIISECLFCVCSYIIIKRKKFVGRLPKNIVKPMLATLASGIVVYHMRNNEASTLIPIFFGVYIVSTILLKTLNSEDKVFLKDLLSLKK